MKVFEDNATMEEKKAAVENIANMHNHMVLIPSVTNPSCASCFSIARHLVKNGEIFLAAYFLNLCDDPTGDKIREENPNENDML